jgi:hypothetical protein
MVLGVQQAGELMKGREEPVQPCDDVGVRERENLLMFTTSHKSEKTVL